MRLGLLAGLHLQNVSENIPYSGNYLYFCRPFVGVAQLVRASDS